MKYAHSAKLSVFSHENENSNNVLEAFLRLFPFNLEENKVDIIKRNATGFNESKIEIYEVMLTKTNLINQFLDFVLSNLDEVQKGVIIQQAESRLDDDLDFFIRFDKEEWTEKNKIELTESGKCFHLKMSIAAFPKKREVALKIINELFSK
ncbi:hypothetical protein HY637_01480 [Candidatus Woesearchaeota archaeon]|nr:hypothetical protein [Candidatus Woesearchaeota archaeon]